EDGIRDFHVTGVQTCALPICQAWHSRDQNSATEHRDKQREASERRGAHLGTTLGGTEKAVITGRSLRVPRTMIWPGARTISRIRSEERRVGNEWQARWTTAH